MRVSNYEIILPLIDRNENIIESHVLLINGLYGAVDVIKKEELEKINAGKICSLSVELRNRLFSRGHLTLKDGAGEFKYMRMLSRIYKMIPGRSNIGMVIMPTYDCNFRCPYCFEKHRLGRGQDWLDRTISQKLITAAFSALRKYKALGYGLGSCTLYGGEPLLEKNITIVRDICKQAKEIKMNINAITNGYDLEAYLDLMEEFQFENIQVTVDGAYTVNDCRRVHKSGAPTYERLLKNIESTLNRGIDVILRVNVGYENIDGIKDLIDDLNKRSLLSIKRDGIESSSIGISSCKKARGMFSYYFKAATSDDEPGAVLKEKDVINELIRIGFKPIEAMALESQYSMYLSLINQLLNKQSFLEFSPSFCGAEAGMLVIDPLGRIFSCWDSVAKENDIVGMIDVYSNKALFNFNKAKWRTRTTDNLINCQKCSYAFICRGGCASRALYEHGDYFREFCGETKDIFSFVVSRVIGSRWAKGKDDSLSLSLAEPISKLSETDIEILLNTCSQEEMFKIASMSGIFPKKAKNG